MHSRSPELTDGAHFCVGGNVVVHPSAVIASGVLLQADPGSQLRVAAGVSIGAGSILHAHRGILEVQESATIGSQVLVMGRGVVGQRACIGAAASLLFDLQVEPHQVIPPGSSSGDPGAGVSVSPPSPAGSIPPPSAQPSPDGSSPPEEAPPPPDDLHAAEATLPPESSTAASAPASPSASTVKFAHVYGRTSVERLMQMMFYRNGSGQEGADAPTQSTPQSTPQSTDDHVEPSG